MHSSVLCRTDVSKNLKDKMKEGLDTEDQVKEETIEIVGEQEPGFQTLVLFHFHHTGQCRRG